MRRLTWIVTLAAVAVWSGLCWIAHGLIGIGGNLVAGNREILVQTGTYIESAADVRRLVVGVHDKKPVFMRMPLLKTPEPTCSTTST